MVSNDIANIDLNLTDDQIGSLTKPEFKKIVKCNMRSYTHTEFKCVKKCHSKVKHISHKDLKKPQHYIMDAMFNNNETSLLFNLRSQSVNEFKANFQISICPFCKFHLDTQEHALSCNILRSHMEIKFFLSKTQLTTMIFW